MASKWGVIMSITMMKKKETFSIWNTLLKTRGKGNGYRIWQKSQRKRGDGYRNWKRVFTWAQEESKLNLFFISSVWLQSPYCLGELADLIKLKYKNSSKDKLNKHGLFSFFRTMTRWTIKKMEWY